MTVTEIETIERALEIERRMKQRQDLLRQIWRLKHQDKVNRDIKKSHNVRVPVDHIDSSGAKQLI